MNTHETEGPSPFHKHEQMLQERVGKRDVMENFARKVVRSYLPEQHREFYSQLPYIILGSVDEHGDTWASIIAGQPGFISSPTPTSLDLVLRIANGDPLKESIKRIGTSIGMLGINLENRRRNRVNVRVTNVVDDVANLSVDQSFGNCPQYIQSRTLNYSSVAHAKSEVGDFDSFTQLDRHATALIEHADTFFVSSFIVETNDPTREGVDVSHRGGRPGFIKVDGDTLTIPDYPGNYHFNTLGNFLANPKAGLMFPNFETGDILTLTGSTEILWEDHPEVKYFNGAQRAWRFRVKKGKWLRKALPFATRFNQYSVNSEMTGTWREAEQRKAAEKLRSEWQPMKLVKVVEESSVIKSFYFQHAKDKALLPFEAGQFMTVKVPSQDIQNPLIRTYTVSSAPHDPYYRISVKKEPSGAASNLMHDTLSIGDIIEAKYPSGHFYIDTVEKRPAVLIAGGVGVTPMISMAQHTLNEAIRTRHLRPMHIFCAAKNSKQRAFHQAFKQIAQDSSNAIHYYSLLSQPDSNDKPGKDFNGSGRLTADVFKQVLNLDDYDFYICGPSSFMQSMYDELMTLGVRDSRIYAEAFGPASLTRKPERAVKPVESSDEVGEAEQSVIKFSQSGFEQRWNKGDDVILDVAESHGLTPSSSCRNGICGACAVPVKSGKVSYRMKPSAQVPDGHALICCAVPSKETDVLDIEL